MHPATVTLRLGVRWHTPCYVTQYSQLKIGAMTKQRALLVTLLIAMVGALSTFVNFQAKQAFSEKHHGANVVLDAAMLAKAEKLISAYPDHLKRIDGNELIWNDGSRILFDDGRKKTTLNERLRTTDIEDQFAYVYKKGRPTAPPAQNSDPGRVRFDPFFVKMYGDCNKGDVEKTLAPVQWLAGLGGGTLMATTINGVNKKLEAVSRDLEKLPTQFTKYLVPVSGVYNCRKIAGTERRSMHAYAAAIDINVKHADYWRWQTQGKAGAQPYRNKIPFEIVEVFEKYGFIWGGKWHHFDTMHFEYRPELID